MLRKHFKKVKKLCKRYSEIVNFKFKKFCIFFKTKFR